jgi:hypothetical protein
MSVITIPVADEVAAIMLMLLFFVCSNDGFTSRGAGSELLVHDRIDSGILAICAKASALSMCIKTARR